MIVAESTITLHTWPENGYIQGIVDTCANMTPVILKAIKHSLQVEFDTKVVSVGLIPFSDLVAGAGSVS